jgi:uncharacterized protein
MKAANLTTLVLIIIGGLNWGVFGLTHVDLIASLFGPDTAIVRAIYILIGLAALYQFAPLSRAIAIGEVLAESGRRYVVR